MKSDPRFTALVLASLALAASACRPPVFFPEFGVDTSGIDAENADVSINGTAASWLLFTKHRRISRSTVAHSPRRAPPSDRPFP